jgi:hypothetical protein
VHVVLSKNLIDAATERSNARELSV